MPNDFINVYIASIPTKSFKWEVFPKRREDEIKSCENEQKRKEKYYVWKLLEYAIKKTFNKDIKDVKFNKSTRGKWISDEFEFSLSHSNEVVAVAISNGAVGIDVEMERKIRKDVAQKILSSQETIELDGLEEQEKNEFLLKKWTQKESAFKICQEYNLKKVDVKNTKTYTIKHDGNVYYMSLAYQNECKIDIFDNIQL